MLYTVSRLGERLKEVECSIERLDAEQTASQQREVKLAVHTEVLADTISNLPRKLAWLHLQVIALEKQVEQLEDREKQSREFERRIEDLERFSYPSEKLDSIKRQKKEKTDE